MEPRNWWVDNTHYDLRKNPQRGPDGDLRLLLCELIREIRALQGEDLSDGMMRGLRGDTKVGWLSTEGLSNRARRVVTESLIAEHWVSTFENEADLQWWTSRLTGGGEKIPCGKKTVAEIWKWLHASR